jgi:intracellular multiplication protein IcmB
MKRVDAYCDLAGMSDPADLDRPCVYAHDGSTCTIIRVRGAQSHLSPDEAGERMMLALGEIATNLRERGHAMTVSFEQSANIGEDIERLMAPLHDASTRKGLSMVASLGETQRLLEQQLVSERILIALWTYRDAAVTARLREDLSARRDAFGRLGLSRGAQDPSGPYESLRAAHWGFVLATETALENHGFLAERLGGQGGSRTDLAEIRRTLLFHETPPNWKPAGPGDIRYPMAKGRKSADISTLFAPTLNRQIMTSAAQATSDLRTVELGGRQYAIAYLSAFPRYMPPFRQLLDNLRGTGTRQRILPFRIAMHLEGGARVDQIRRVLATIGSVFSPQNKNIRLALDGISAAMQRDEETFVQARIYACTWTEPGEDATLLADRRSRLTRALNAWQSPTVTDSCGDPLRLLVETAPGMVAVARTGNPFLAPVREISQSLPFHSDAPVEQEGQTVFVTLDGKPMPFAAHSPLQTSWLTLIWAPPGSGKSVILNAMNLDFAAFYKGADLPFIGAMDIGESSRGFIDLLQASLRPDERHLVQYIRLKNEIEARQYRVNPFDLGLGRRAPLKREQSFGQNVLMAMIGNDNPLMAALVENLITNIYQRTSDMEVTSSCKVWQPAKNPDIDRRAQELGIPLHEDLTWWALTDAFARHGDFAMAERAQRFAMPTMNDVIRYLSDGQLRSRFGDDLCNLAAAQIESAINQFPIFANETQLDVGDARIVSIELRDVIHMNPNSDQDRRSNVLFFLMAREIFVKRVAGSSDEIGSMRLPADSALRRVYTDYWRQRYTNIEQTRKRFCFDEFHVTGSSPLMAAQIDQDIRQGRKWGFEVYLASQRIQDFEKYVDLASNVLVLKSDTERDRMEMHKVLGVSDAVVETVRKHVNGPSKDIAIAPVFLIGRKTTRGESWLFAKNRIGPVRLWALSTTLEDRAVRNALYTMTGDVNTALELLAARFPNGTCGDYWKQVAGTMDAQANIAEAIAERLLAEHAGLRQAAE